MRDTLWCDQPNRTSHAELRHDTNYFLVLKLKFVHFYLILIRAQFGEMKGYANGENRGVTGLRVQRIRVCLIITSRVAL